MTKKNINLDLLDKKYIWHPFTQMKEYVQSDNLIIKQGNGNYLIDIYNKKYIDGVSSLWCNLLGHNNKFINNKIIKQIKKISHSTFLGSSNIPAILLGKELIEITPDNLKKVFYSDSGATAVEIGLKAAYQYFYNKGENQKKYFIHLENSYHGDTLGAVSVGGINLFHKIFHPLLFKSLSIPSPYCYRCKFNLKYPECKLKCAEELETVCINKKYKGKIAGIIIEPLVQGAGGMIVSPKGYLKKIYNICRKNNILFIADEVATGFYRTGKLFACNYENIKPDILCLAKSLTNGYLPLSATLFSDKIYNAFLGEFEEFKTFFHGHTFTGNQLGATAGLATLQLLKKIDKKLLSKKIEFIKNKLNEIKKINIVGDVRQKGFMIGIEIVKNKKTKERFEIKKRVGWNICQDCIKEGVFLRPLSDVIVIMPQITINFKNLNKIFEVVKKNIKNYC